MHVLAGLSLGIKLEVCYGVQEVIAFLSLVELFITVRKVGDDLFERIDVFFHVGTFDVPEIAQEVHPLLLLHVREGIKACVECTESMPSTVSRDVLASDDLMGSRVVTGLVQHVKDLSIDLSIKVGSWSFRCTWSNRVFSSRKPSLDAEIRKEAGFP